MLRIEAHCERVGEGFAEKLVRHREPNRFLRDHLRLYNYRSLRPEFRFGLLDSRIVRFSYPGRNESATE